MAEKLVRDFIPYIMMRDTGKIPKMRTVTSKQEILHFALKKLDEEVAELKEAMANPAILDDGPLHETAVLEAAEEAADVCEVVRSLIDSGLITQKIKEKRTERGGFDQVVVVDFPE